MMLDVRNSLLEINIALDKLQEMHNKNLLQSDNLFSDRDEKVVAEIQAKLHTLQKITTIKQGPKKYGFLLFIIATILSILTLPIGIAFTAIWNLFNKKFNERFLQIAISIDQNGNVIMQDVFNGLFKKRGGCSFGNPNETISSVLGKNESAKTLSKFGNLIAIILNKIDPNHTFNSIDTAVPCMPE